MTTKLEKEPTAAVEPACHGTSDASSCSMQPARSSPPRATTLRRWTTSQTRQESPNPCCISTFPQNLISTWRLDQSCDRLVEVVEEALASTEDNADRVSPRSQRSMSSSPQTAVSSGSSSNPI